MAKSDYIAKLQNLAFDDDTNSFKVNSILRDLSGKYSSNSIFGDAIVGQRIAQITGQFQYPLASNNTKNTVVDGGSIYQQDSQLIVETSSIGTSSALVQTIQTIRYIPGNEIYFFFTTVFNDSVDNQTQSIGLYDDNSGFFIGYKGTTFSFTHRRDGVDNDHIIDLDGFEELYGYRFDPKKGNIYKISFGYLGYAPIRLEVLSPNGKLLLMSIIEYPNTATQTHVTQTFLPLRAEVSNNGTTNSINLKIGSVSAGIVSNDSNEYRFARNFSYTNRTTITIPNSVNLFTLRSKSIFGGITNYIKSRLLVTSGANDLNKNSRWLYIRNPIFTNTPTWTDVNTNSIMEYSTDAIIDTVNSNDLLLAFNLSKTGSFIEQVERLNIDLNPEESICVYLETDGAGEADTSLRWTELF